MTPPQDTQKKQSEWADQWSLLQDHERFLFEDWIWPVTLESFRGRTVLECGCGGGQHTSFVAPLASHVTAVDLNTTAIAQERNKALSNITFLEADIAAMDLKRQFDDVMSIGVVHHTDNPDQTVANLIRHVRPGGRLILWVYSKEGNFLAEYGVEPIRKLLLTRLPRRVLLSLSQLLTGFLFVLAHTLYRLPLYFLPYYDYLKNFRKLSFGRNVLNVFDKLNAPQVQWITESRIKRWFDPHRFENIQITSYCGVSWRGSGRLKETP